MTITECKGKIEKAAELNISMNHLCSWSTDEKLAVADEGVGMRTISYIMSGFRPPPPQLKRGPPKGLRLLNVLDT